MLISRFDPATDTRELQACFEMTKAGWPADHPNVAPWPLASFAGKWTHGFDACPQECWLAVDDDARPAGGYVLRLDDKENASLARCTLIVSPDRRRAGVGRLLAAHCADRARAAGRTKLQASVRDDSPGAAFAAALGATGGIPNVDRVLLVDDALAGRLAGLRSAALPRAAGYTLTSWVGPVPEEFLDHVVRLNNAMADAPRDAGVEPKVWDAERIRELEQTSMACGLRLQAVMARHELTGAVAALTELCVEEDTPDWAYQMMTAVLPGHRGRRLGLLVKIANLELLAETEPRVRRVFTGNAGSNEHMIAINAQLGFQVADVYRSWELDLTAPTG